MCSLADLKVLENPFVFISCPIEALSLLVTGISMIVIHRGIPCDTIDLVVCNGI